MQRLKALIDSALVNLPWSVDDAFDLGGKGFVNPKVPALDNDLTTKTYVDTLIGNTIFDEVLVGAATLINRTGPSLNFYHGGESDASGNLIPVARTQPRASGGLVVFDDSGSAKRVLTIDDVTIETGSFTPTWFGFSSPPTSDINYIKQTFTDASGNTHGVVHLYQDVVPTDGASNQNIMGISTWPDNLKPASLPSDIPCMVIDSGNARQGMIRITSTQILFYVAEVSGSTIVMNNSGFTTSGLKGPSNLNISYAI